MVDIDRSNWPSGTWDREGDLDKWITEDGYACMMVRNKMGAWCGYVAVPKKHPWYGCDYDQRDPKHRSGGRYLTRVAKVLLNQELGSEPDYELSIGSKVEVHGGLTFAGKHPEGGDGWWFGFDCAHAGDLIPGMLQFDPPIWDHETYKDESYVRDQVDRLLRQLRSV